MLKKLLVLLPALALMLAIVSPVRAAAEVSSDHVIPYDLHDIFADYYTQYDNYFMYSNGDRYYELIGWNDSDPVDCFFSDDESKLYFISTDSDFIIPHYMYDVPFASYGVRDSSSSYIYYYNFSDHSMYRLDIVGFPTNDYSMYSNYVVSSSGIVEYVYDISAVDDSLKVDVSFDPDLSGVVDRSISSGWTRSTVDNLHVSISSNRNIQYCWAIVDRGCTVHFNDGNSRFVNYNGKTFVDTNHDLRYVYITSEWNYCAGTTSQVDSAHEARGKIVKVLSACSWHYLSKGQTQELDVSFNQMNLSSSDDYDVVVYAIPTDLDIVSCIPYGSGSAMDGYDPSYAVDFSQVVEVYRSGFSLAQSTNFDPDDSSFGVYAYDPQNDNSFSWDKADAFYTDDGEMVIRDTSIKDFVSGHDSSSWSTWHGSSSGGSDVTSSITTVTKSVSSYFGFLNAVFAYLPNVFTSLLGVGFTAFIVLGILRVLLGR